MKKIIVTIDGYASCGKSTLARDAAAKLGYKYIDSGAMYRAVTYYFLKKNVAPEDPDQVAVALQQIHLNFSYDPNTGEQITHLNGEAVEKAIRKPEVSNYVSQVSAIKAVRQKLVEQQQQLGREKGIVMDGRDIGTVVFPNAELKIFLKASEEVRLDRRCEELEHKGQSLNKEEIQKNLIERDYIDSTRSESPLQQASDAIVLDNSQMTLEEQANWVYERAMEVIKS